VRVAGRPVQVPGARQRALLAALLLRRGHVVPVDTLVDEVFGEAPPREARNALQTYVVRLRQALGPAAPFVATRAPGYVLEVPADAVDAERFTGLLGQARASEPPAGALALLDRALGLWRGPAYAEFAATFARGEAPRLSELRLAAQEDRAVLLLRLDRVAEAAAALEAVAAAEPWRERARWSCWSPPSPRRAGPPTPSPPWPATATGSATSSASTPRRGGGGSRSRCYAGRSNPSRPSPPAGSGRPIPPPGPRSSAGSGSWPWSARPWLPGRW
jgi:Bacterial transcriptional activator domain